MRTPVRIEHTNSRGERTRVLGWPAEGAKATMVVHHGLGEHIGRYQTYADHLDGLPVSIWGYDCRGHGESTEVRGRALGIDQLADDLVEMIPVLLGHSGTDRMLLWGHSMGAAVVLWALTRRPQPKTMIALGLSAPPVVVRLDLAQRIKVVVGRIGARLAPELTLATGIPATGISTVAAEVRRYEEDPLIHGKVSLGLAKNLVDDVPSLVSLLSRIAVPTYVLHGDADPISLVEGGRAVAAGISGATYHEYPGLAHESHHESPEAVARVFADIKAWLAGPGGVL